MNAEHIISRKRYLKFEERGPELGIVRRIARRLWSLLVLPAELASARRVGTPGLPDRVRCIRFGLRALFAGDVRRGLGLIADPMDSFRYFEVSFAVDAARRAPVERYLDVSSPRLIPLMILDDRPDLVADLLNPHASDLRETSEYAKSLGLLERCRLSDVLIEDAKHEDGTFDLITSVSVVEHIPQDSNAVAKLWRLLRPGGRLVITVPCAREACEEYSNLDEYSLLNPDGSGFVYWQRYYDESALAARFWSVVGKPAVMRIWGEREAGSYDANVVSKRTDPTYPYWREPTMFGSQFREFTRLDELPGMGVVAMEFVKEANPSGAK